MRALSLSCFAALLVAAAVPTGAMDVVLDGEGACLAIGGIWDGQRTCLVRDFGIEFGTTLIVAPGVTLVSEGFFSVVGPLINRGTFVGNGTIANYAPIRNTGVFRNRGWLHPEGPVENDGVFENEGLLDVCIGAVRNRAYLHNADTIENWGVMENDGLIVNDGYIHNPDLGFVGITNRGAVDHNGVLENEGSVLCVCGAAWYGNGDVSGIPVEFEACEPLLAIQRVRRAVIDLGPQAQGILSKKHVIALFTWLDKAAKRLSAGRPDLTAALLEAFVGQAGALVADGDLPLYIGQALAARADRIIDLVSSAAGPMP